MWCVSFRCFLFMFEIFIGMMPESKACSSHFDLLYHSTNHVRDILLCQCPQGTCLVLECRLSWDQDPVPAVCAEGMIHCPPEQVRLNEAVVMLD
jgi:hypothetical protein